MYYRAIAERVEKIAPFLTFDRDPYLVIADGKVYWIVDAYTTSDRSVFPAVAVKRPFDSAQGKLYKKLGKSSG